MGVRASGWRVPRLGRVVVALRRWLAEVLVRRLGISQLLVHLTWVLKHVVADRLLAVTGVGHANWGLLSRRRVRRGRLSHAVAVLLVVWVAAVLVVGRTDALSRRHSRRLVRRLVGRSVVAILLRRVARRRNLVWLGRVILSVFTESNCDALGRIAEPEPAQTIHCVLSALLIFVVHECDPLSVLVPGEPDLVKAAEQFEDGVEFFLCNVLRNVADV